MDILLDVHTHTIASGHAFSTLQEMVRTAADKGLKILGITEHSPGIPGTCELIYFRNLHVVPRNMYGVELLLGAEMNIIDYKGNVDMPEEYFSMLDLRIAGIHSLCYQSGTIDENTQAIVGAVRNPAIQIISHPSDGTVPLHFEPIVLAAKENHTLLEINNSSLKPARHKGSAVIIIYSYYGCARNMRCLLYWEVMRIFRLILPIMSFCMNCWWKRTFRKV